MLYITINGLQTLGIMFEIARYILSPMKKLFTVLSFIAVGATGLKAQSYLNLYLNGSCPMDGLKDSAYKDGVGFSIEYLSPSLVKTKNDWFQIRLGFGMEYFYQGGSKRVTDLVFNTPNNDLGSVHINNQMSAFYFAPKFIFKTGRISPYFDVFAASRTFTTNQVNRFNQQVDGYDRETTKRLLLNGRAHYGASLGVIYNLGSRFAFDARVSYSLGDGIKFINLKSVDRDPNYESNIAYHVVKAPVSNVLVYRIGVMFRLKRSENRTRSTGSSTPTQNNINRNRTVTPQVLPKPATPKKKPAEVKPVPKPVPPPKPVEN